MRRLVYVHVCGWFLFQSFNVAHGSLKLPGRNGRAWISLPFPSSFSSFVIKVSVPSSPRMPLCTSSAEKGGLTCLRWAPATQSCHTLRWMALMLNCPSMPVFYIWVNVSLMIQASLNFILRMYGLFMDFLSFIRGFVNEQRSQKTPCIKFIEVLNEIDSRFLILLYSHDLFIFTQLRFSVT